MFDVYAGSYGCIGDCGACGYSGCAYYGAFPVRATRFGLIDNGLLLLSALMGFSLDDLIAKKVGVRGYGPLVGAAVGNAISDGIAGIPEGWRTALGYFGGAMLPVLPLLVAMAGKKKLKGKTAKALGGLSAAMVLAAFVYRRQS